MPSSTRRPGRWKAEAEWALLIRALLIWTLLIWALVIGVGDAGARPGSIAPSPIEVSLDRGRQQPP
jgi:hypothetical protein